MSCNLAVRSCIVDVLYNERYPSCRDWNRNIKLVSTPLEISQSSSVRPGF